MTSKEPFPHSLTQIDALTKADHCRLDNDDCFFLGEYTARKGFVYSETNQLILNLKKSVDRRGRPEWRHKVAAIRQAAEALRNAIDINFIRDTTFVPIPPSKSKDDPLYDDRMLKVLQLIDPRIDVRELILQRESTEACHFNDGGRDPDEIKKNYVLDKRLVRPVPKVIAICDDVLTTGAHFKAAKSLLAERFPEAHMCGMFIARRVPEAVDFEAIFGD